MPNGRFKTKTCRVWNSFHTFKVNSDKKLSKQLILQDVFSKRKPGIGNKDTSNVTYISEHFYLEITTLRTYNRIYI